MSKRPAKVSAEAKLDEALAESFPASDPPAIGHSERVGDPSREPSRLKLRTRKAIGTFTTVSFLIVYSLVAMAVGGQLVVGNGIVLELLFYAIAGILWLPAVMIIVKWMARPDACD
ncbi:MAG: DUF2842 domain-containing protein [Methylococcales bacterium]